MITSIEIDGFKTLRNFKMDFRPGLNVLAGVNGSGKTNILQALELLSRLSRTDVSTAVNTSNRDYKGIFSFTGDSKIKYDITGYIKSGVYKITILIAKDESSGQYECIVNRHSSEDAKNNSRMMRFRSLLATEVNGDERLDMEVTADWYNLYYYDFKPDKIRAINDINDSIIIQFDGSDFSRALFSFEADDYFWTPDKKEVISYFNLIGGGLIDYSVSYDNFTGEIDVRFSKDENNLHHKLGLRSLSDGTVCWMAICVSLLQAQKAFSYDEPDRHLHPDMLRHLVTLFRESAERNNSWILMTTHSETVLNQCYPEEVKIVELNDKGDTEVRPVLDVDTLEDEIYEHGRQMGELYSSGLL